MIHKNANLTSNTYDLQILQKKKRINKDHNNNTVIVDSTSFFVLRVFS